MVSKTLGGRYQLVREIGSGGMGRVCQAVDTETGRIVAAKIMLVSGDDDLDALLRFYQEGAVLSTLKHPNIVEVYGTFQEEQTCCLIMELLEGQSLRQLLATTTLPLSRTKHLVGQVAAALAYAHSRGIVHRDIKPDNIMVVGNDQVKVTDFGIARILRGSATLNTKTGMSIGTPLYMAPEQIEGQKVDGRADMYSLGSVVYEMVTGRPPFEGRDPLSIAFKHVHKAPEPPSEVNGHVPPDWEAVILRMLAKDPADRFQTAEALEDAIASLRVVANITAPPPASPIEASGRQILASEPLRPLLVHGREAQVLRGLLRQDEIQVITLVGPDGIGKTRLALQVAGLENARYPDGVFFGSLAYVADPSLIAATLAHLVGIPDPGDASLAQVMKDTLWDRHMLLVLDDGECLRGHRLWVSDLMRACRHLDILVTSTAPLQLPGECEFPVPPLTTPDPGSSLDPRAVTDSEAVALFLHYAQACDAGFHLTEENMPAVVAICSQLADLPLALELVASRVSLFPLDTVLADLSNRLPHFSTRAPHLIEPHRILQGTIAWSYHLLADEEQRVLRRLSVFAGGCTVDAAETVCRADGDRHLVVMDAVASLVKSRLVHREDGVELRLVIPDAIRHYASEQHAQHGDGKSLSREHALYYLAVTERADAALHGADRQRWLVHLEAEHDNVAVALAWAKHDDPSILQRLVAALSTFWAVSGYATEARYWAKAAQTEVSREETSRSTELVKRKPSLSARGRRRSRTIPVAATGTLAVVLIVLAWSLYHLQAQTTARSHARATAEALVIVHRKATVQAAPTVTAIAKATAAAQLLSRPFGFASGTIQGSSHHVWAGRSLRDFVATADFANPSTMPEHMWDYGLWFRNTDTGGEYRLLLTSDKRYELYLHNMTGGSMTANDMTGTMSLRAVGGGAVPDLNVARGGHNAITLVAMGQTGILAVNGQIIGTLNLSGKTVSGDVGASVDPEGMREMIPPTRFTSFAVWPLTHGHLYNAATGQLGRSQHEIWAGQDVLNFIAAVTFRNPATSAKKSWNYGIWFRNSDVEGQYRLVLTSDKRFALYLHNMAGESMSMPLVNAGPVASLNVSPGKPNDLVLVVAGQSGVLLVNGHVAGTLNTAGKMGGGDVGLSVLPETNNQMLAVSYTHFALWQAGL